ncbi:MAG: hypothetical protein Q9160_006799 [Pyrenula sp. 1 TL-2023]
MGSHPDSHLHPVATGQAAQLVERHAKEDPLKLYSGWFCPFVQRAWVTLEEKSIPYQYIEVNPYDKPQSLLSLNPRGLVPTLSVPTALGSKPLYESNIICEYLDTVYNDESKHGKSLLPSDSYDRARLKIWIDYVTSRIIPAFHRFLQFQGEDMRKAREEFLGHLKTWIKEADPDGPFFYGKYFTLADIALAPWALRLWVFDHYKSGEGGLGMPQPGEGGPDEKTWVRWRSWVKAMEQRKSITETMSDKQYYLSIYQRYADNTAQSELAKATRSGRGVP